ncbi:MAG TPA: alpha/beta hydrolase [Streptosporangiaceae bacterium]|jgi:acetyl esterase|nr:alpha/beta hydrolase [Streptosporangiaceae bacterium]
MPFHPQVQAIRDRLDAASIPNLYTLPIEEAREQDIRGIRATGGTPEPVAEVRDFTIPGPAGDIEARIYRPELTGQDAAGQAPAGPLPALVYFFGGGWALGVLDTADAVGRMIANRAGCACVTISYRLAPENKFPAAVQDCYAGAAWVAAHANELGLDQSRIAVGGDSSGGNLAAAVTLMARERGGPAFVHQLLVYPNTDATADTDSMREVVDEHFFNKNAIAWYWSMYLASPDDGLNPLASPLKAADLSGLPAATVITAELDPLRDESEQYGEALAKAGVPVEIIRYDGMMHGFFTMVGILDTAREAVATAADRLSRAFTASA